MNYDIACAVLGLAIGAPVGWLVSAPGPTEGSRAVPLVSEVYRASSPACEPPVQRARKALELARRDLDHAHQASDELQGRLDEVFGVPMAFPDSLDPVFRPDGLEARLQAALQDSGAELVSIDCEEYPCLAVVDLGEPQGVVVVTEDGHSQIQSATGDLKTTIGEAFPHWSGRIHGGSGGSVDERTSFAVLSLDPDETNGGKRIRYRMRLSVSYFEAELDVEEP